MPKGVYVRTAKAKRSISISAKGRKNPFLAVLNRTPEHRELVRRTMKSRKGKLTVEERAHRSRVAKQAGIIPPHYKGAHHYNWKGGITSEHEKIRKSKRYKAWRLRVFKRDKYTCIHCDQVGGYLEADHIKPFATHPELRFKTSNGRTLCKECHKKTPTYGRKAINV